MFGILGGLLAGVVLGCTRLFSTRYKRLVGIYGSALLLMFFLEYWNLLSGGCAPQRAHPLGPFSLPPAAACRRSNRGTGCQQCAGCPRTGGNITVESPACWHQATCSPLPAGNITLQPPACWHQATCRPLPARPAPAGGALGALCVGLVASNAWEKGFPKWGSLGKSFVYSPESEPTAAPLAAPACALSWLS